MVVPIIFGIIMGIAHFFSEEFYSRYKTHYSKIISFSAGIAVTYIFLDLFPNFSEGAAQIDKLLFLSVLIGFVAFHLIEKYIYQHSPEEKLFRELAIEDSVISFLYHFVIGMLIVSFLNQDLLRGTLFFIPVLVYTAVSTLPVDITKFKSLRIIVASSTLLGILFAAYIYTTMSPLVFNILLGFIVGTLSFTVTRHSIPIGKKGEPLYFTIGVLFYTIILFLLLYR
jgi:hypothetical protein